MMKRFALASLAVLSLWWSGAAASAQTIFVTTVQDKVDFALPQQVVNLPGPDGLVSMREATIAANKTPGSQTIGFQIPAGAWGTGTTGPVIVNASTSFGLSDDGTTIDGTTQTAFTGDTNPDGAEVSFFSTTTEIPLIQTGIFVVSADHCRFIGLGNMLGRNYGIDLGPLAEDTHVTGCSIRAVFAAVRVQGDFNVIGGTAPVEGNFLDSLADGLRIQGQIGGSEVPEFNVAIGNVLTGDFNGVQITGGGMNNRIGGFAPGEANLINGAGYLQEDGTPDGAMVRIESDFNFVLGNLLGTDATGTLAANNDADVGVEIYGDGNIVQGNVIGGITGLIGFLSVQAGVSLREGAENNVIKENHIGTDATGAIPIPNGVGIRIAAFDPGLPQPGNNLIGGEGDGNVIANNETGGVVVAFDSKGNRIEGNTIRDNSSMGGIGIDLGADGRTPNDLGDADVGSNDLMNFPRVSSAVGSSQGTVVIGRLDTANPQTATLEFFANSPPPPGVPAEAAKPMGTVAPATPAANGTFLAVIDGDATTSALTATATDSAGNTSEICDALIVQPSPWSDAGFAKPGTNGEPALFGGGTLVAGTPVAVVVVNALPSSSGVWILSTTTAFLPLLGGTLVPTPTLIVPLATDSDGIASLGGTFPGAPSGTTIVVQAWISDPGGFGGAAASNGIIGTVP